MLLSILLLTLLFSIIVYMVINITIIIFLFMLEIFGVMALNYFVTVFATCHFIRSFHLPCG